MFTKLPEHLGGIYPEGYYQGFDLTLWYIAIGLSIITGGFFLFKIRKVKLNIQKRYFASISCVLLFTAITRIFYILGSNSEEINYEQFILIGYMFSLTGLTLFLMYLETIIIKKSRHIITIITFMGVILSILGLLNILDQDLIRLIVSYLPILAFITILVIHYLMIKRGIGEIKTKAIILTIGLILFILGVIGDSQLFYETLPNAPDIFPPLVHLIGIVTMAFSGPLYVDAIFSLVHKGFRYF